VKYDPDAWVKLAKDAGMKYIVITTKHHDGFCLWDSKQTDWDIASTPYGKDLLKPLAEACAKHGIKLCFYHSIMDWHHPTGETRPMARQCGDGKAGHGQIHRLHEGPAQGACSPTTAMSASSGSMANGRTPGPTSAARTSTHGFALSPKLIINNRVDKGRDGMAGHEQGGQIRRRLRHARAGNPANGLPGVDWESCMTMNEHLGLLQT
jgi:alpha-L-fucosidase